MKKRTLGAILAALLLIGCSNDPAGPGSSSRTGNLSSASPAVAEAIKALRKVEAATQVGVSYQQYGPLVVDAKAEVNEALVSLPPSELKGELSAAMDAYADAGMIWGNMLRYDFILFIGEPERSLQRKYSIPEDHSSQMYKGARRETVLRTIWAAANGHLNRAAELTK